LNIAILQAADFFLRGIVLLGIFLILFSNIRTIQKHRAVNMQRKTIKLYKTIVYNLSFYASCVASAFLAVSIWRLGSLLKFTEDRQVMIVFLNNTLFDYESFTTVQTPILIISFIGAVLYIVFCIVRILAYLELGKNFSDFIDIKEGNNLVTTGIYSRIRHPIYMSDIMIPLSAGIALFSWTTFLWTLFIVLPLFIIRANKEDELLEHYYGREFLFYKQRTNGFIPTIFKKEL